MAVHADRLLLYARTLSNLRPSQIVYLARRRVIAWPAFLPARQAAEARTDFELQRGIERRSPTIDERELRFLNVAKSFDPDRFDWTSADMTRLWRYNLHYFDYILDRARSAPGIARLLDDWIARNQVGIGEAWEPYPVSLRIVNWVKLFVRDEFRGRLPARWLSSLHQQANWLEGNLEYHLLANHLLKNGKALLFAGAFLAGADARRWLRKGLRILTEQAREQILDDGGHFERSPMYHALVVEDYLDALNVLRSAGDAGCDAARKLMTDKTRAALNFLRAMRYPDGTIPLFNDAALGIAPTFDELAEYAGRIIGYRTGPGPRDIHIARFDCSGYFIIRDGERMLVVDCGHIGPAYQCGHAHCDTLSFEMVLDGRKVIVDGGVYDYEDSAMRRYVRSTAAHNTAMIDGCEQSQMWGAFRVGRRAAPAGADIGITDDATAWFVGSHNGFAHLPGKPVHSRRIEYNRTTQWTIVDSFSGHGEHAIDSFLHLHPDLSARLDGNRVVIGDGHERVATIDVVHPASIVLERGWHCPEFGKKQSNYVIKVSSRRALPFDLTYRVTGAATASSGGGPHVMESTTSSWR